MPTRPENGASRRARIPAAAPSDDLDSALAWAAGEGFEAVSSESLTGDVSARRYVRLDGSVGSAILALYPPELSSTCRRFVRSSRLLGAAGIRVPELLATDCAHGRMLLEDVGRRTLYEERGRGWAELEPYLERAVEIAARIATLSPDSVEALNPALDEAALRRELENTWVVALGEPDLGRAGFPPALATALAEMLSRLAESPRAVAHRDLMARNLVPMKGTGQAAAIQLAVLDHQDLRLAPAAYDLASLLNDSLYPPRRLEERLVSKLVSSGRILDYHRAAAQRCLKIVGTFVAFEQAGDARHRPLVAPSLERARRHLATLPEMDSQRGAIDDLLAALGRARPSG